MGGVEGKQGAWAYPEGGKMVSPSHNTFMLNWWVLGMGAVSSAMAKSAVEKGVTIFTDQVRLYWNICFSWSISDMKNEMTFNKFFFFSRQLKKLWWMTTEALQVFAWMTRRKYSPRLSFQMLHLKSRSLIYLRPERFRSRTSIKSNRLITHRQWQRLTVWDDLIFC